MGRRVVLLTSTTTSITLSTNPVTYGNDVAIQVFVTPSVVGATLTGTVTFFAGGVRVGSSAVAQTPLSAYVDANGFLNVQTLTCAQLAGTFQEDADALTTWYSGWYNGLAKKHYLDYRNGKVVEHEVIQYCKANPGKLIIEAIAVVFKDERAKLGIQMKAD